MKKIAFLFILFILASCQSRNEISYRVSPSKKDGKPSLNVSMNFKANPSGETVLLLQDKAWGQENLYNTLSNLKSPEATQIIKEKDSNRITLLHDKNIKKLSFSYTLQQDTEGSLATRDTYRPIIDSSYFHIFSHNFFMIPRDYVPNSHEPFDVKINWTDFPDDYNFINSFDTNNREQEIKNTNERYFHSAIFTGGDYKPYRFEINNNEVVLGIRGEWKVFKDSTMVEVLKKTLKAQRDFWQDHSQKYFGVTMIPTNHLQRGSSFQGSGLTNSFATSASNNNDLEPQGLVYLFNHELQHNWLGHVIKNENEEEQYWFSEGFTDYYTFKNIAKNHIYKLDKSYFIDEFNNTIKALFTSPVREAPNSEINYENYWSSWDYSKLPYRRGAIFAFYLDNKINKESNGKKSLGDLLLTIKNDAVKNDQRLTHSYFLIKANELLKEDITPFFQKHIIDGHLYDMKAILSEFGYEINPTLNVFDLGFEFTEDKLRIKTIDPDSNAFKAGLREGDRLTYRSYYEGVPTFEAEFKVKKGTKEKSYTFYPSKKANIPSIKNNKNNQKALPF